MVGPRIVATFEALHHADDPKIGARRRARYIEAIERHGGIPLPLDETADSGARAAAFDSMSGLLLAGGADVAPALYGEAPNGTRDVQPGRDELELDAFRVARERRVPVLGICRGIQAINVFMGGRLLQHVDGHEGPGYLTGGHTHMHELRLSPGTRVAELLDTRGTALSVNSYHHQGITPDGLAPGLIVAGTSPAPRGELVEAVESADPDWFVVGVQCHPERTEFTPPQFERLFAAFVAAARRAQPAATARA